MMRRIAHIVALVLVLAGMSSCIRATLHDPLSDLYLKTEFVLESGVMLPDGFPADNPDFANKIVAPAPSTIRICFYDPDTMELVKTEFLPSNGGFLDVTPGQYYILMYAMGTTSSQIYNMDKLNTAFASTNPTGLTLNIFVGETKAVEDYAIFNEPDHLLVCKSENIVTIPRHTRSGEAIKIEAKFTSVVKTYSFQLSDVAESDRIARADLYISGQTPGVYVWDHKIPENRASALKVPCHVDPDKGTISTVFNSFGRLPDHNVFAYLMITDKQGHKFQLIYDITDKIIDPNNPIIEIDDPITIPDQEGGFSQEVHLWEEETIVVPLN